VRVRTLSNSESSSASIAPRCSFANVLRRRSLSSVPRLRLWYTSRARVVSTVSPGRGSGSGGGRSAGDAVEAMCSGVWGIGHGSLSVTVEEDRCLVEITLWYDARMRGTEWRRKIDMVLSNRVFGGRWPTVMLDITSPRAPTRSQKFKRSSFQASYTNTWLCCTLSSWYTTAALLRHGKQRR